MKLGANLAPGTSVSKLTVNNGAWLHGNTIMEVSGAGHDQLAVSGTLTNGGTLTVLLSGAVYGGEVLQWFTAGQFVGDFIQIDLPTLPAGMSWDTEALNTAGVLSISGGARKINVSRNGNNQTFAWAGSGYRLLAQTNSLAVGLSSSWGPYPGGG